MNDVTIQTILIGGGIIFIFFGIIGYIILPKKIGPKLTMWTRICLVTIGIVFLIFGIFFYPPQSAPPVSPTPTQMPSQPPSPTPPVEPYIVYSDIGIPGGDVWVWSGADWGLEPPRLVDGNYVIKDAPEGSKCFAVTSGSGYGNYVGWGVFLGVFDKKHKLITPHTVDLSDYENLEFWVKTSVDLKVEIQQDNDKGKKSSPCFISNYGWNSGSSDVWQRVAIPKSAFRNVDLTKIFCPFMITGKGSEITFYVDKVMWIPRSVNETK